MIGRRVKYWAWQGLRREQRAGAVVAVRGELLELDSGALVSAACLVREPSQLEIDWHDEQRPEPPEGVQVVEQRGGRVAALVAPGVKAGEWLESNGFNLPLAGRAVLGPSCEDPRTCN